MKFYYKSKFILVLTILLDFSPAFAFQKIQNVQTDSLKNKDSSNINKGDTASSYIDNKISSKKSRKNIDRQQKRILHRAIEISFDETGQMIVFPQPVTKRNQALIFKVRQSRSGFAAHVNQLLLRMDSVYNFFVGKQQNQFVLWTLFKDDTTLVKDWLYEVDKYLAIRQILSEGREYNLSQYASSDTNRLYTYISSLKYLPINNFIQSLLFKQFSIRTFDISGGFNHELFLTPDFKSQGPDQNDCYWWCSQPIILDTLMGKNCAECRDNLKFSLIYRDPWKETVLDWYNITVEKLDSCLKESSQKIQIQQKLETLLRENDILKDDERAVTVEDAGAITDEILKFAEKFDEDGKWKDTVTAAHFESDRICFASPYLFSNRSKLSITTADYLKTLRVLKFWFISWLWYNNGFLVIDPIPSLKGPSSDSTNAKIKNVNRFLKRLQEQKSFLDSVKLHVADSIEKFKLYKEVQDTIDIVNSQIDSVDSLIKVLNESIKKDSVSKAYAENFKKQSSIAGIQSYVGQIPVYGGVKLYKSRTLFPGKISVQKQFSYSASQQSFTAIYNNQRQKMMANEFPENEHILLTIHNIPRNSKLGVSQTLSGFNDLEEFTLLLQKLMKGLDSTGLFGLALPSGISGFTNFLQTTLSRTSQSTAIAAAAKVAGIAVSRPNAVDAMTFDYLQSSARNSPVSYSPGITVALNIPKKIDTTQGYLTKIYPVVDSVAPYMVNLGLAIDSIKAKSSIQVGALHRFQLTAGFAVVRNPKDQIAIDTSGSGFRTSSTSNNTSVIAGFKIYPFKTYLRDGSLIPRYPFRRLSALIAFSIPKPLNNFYFGAAYDFVPGLTFSIGENIYKQNYYEVQNARITKSAVRYAKGGTYYAVTVNPVILVQFVKLFFN